MVEHKVFISYQHIKPDQDYRDNFEFLANQNDICIVKSVQISGFDPNSSTDYVRQKIRDEYLRDSTVTVVLIGPTTWQMKHVDWEISSSIHSTIVNSKSGLLGIILPNHSSFGKPGYAAGIVPPRLVSNQICGYAKIYDWTTHPSKICKRINEALERRSVLEPDNSYPHFTNNMTANRWR